MLSASWPFGSFHAGAARMSVGEIGDPLGGRVTAARCREVEVSTGVLEDEP